MRLEGFIVSEGLTQCDEPMDAPSSTTMCEEERLVADDVEKPLGLRELLRWR
jgi:hypothetical protein